MVERIAELTEILPYVREFLGKTFVIKLGGEVLYPNSIESVAKQISLIHHMGIKVVLVHGGGPQLDETLDKFGIAPKIVEGRRVTDNATLQVAKMVFKGLLGTDLVAALRKEGATAVSLSGVDAGLIAAKRRAPKLMAVNDGSNQALDYGEVGDITAINPAVIESLLSSSIIPCVCSLGISDQAQVLNINADTVAASLAHALKAEKLILMTNVAGVLQSKEDPSSLVSYASVERLEQMIAAGAIKDGMRPKVEACMQAVRMGVPRTHIINGAKPGALLMELFLNEGCGTMVVNDQEQARYELAVEAG